MKCLTSLVHPSSKPTTRGLIFGFLTGVILCFSNTVISAEYTGRMLQTDCELKKGSNDFQSGIHYGLCHGFIIGVGEVAMNTIRGAFCPPPTADKVKSVEILQRYLQKHPERLREPAAVLVVNALGEAFPCPKR